MRGIMQKLEEFVRTSGTYVPETAKDIARAISLYDEVITDQEASSIDRLIKSADAIMHRLWHKYPSKYKEISVKTFKSRVIRAASDFKELGEGATLRQGTSKPLPKRLGEESAIESLELVMPGGKIVLGVNGSELTDADKEKLKSIMDLMR
jgi:hypothetical protein